MVGTNVGAKVGDMLGVALGLTVGLAEVGALVGAVVGDVEGEVLGEEVGEVDGLVVGSNVGCIVGGTHVNVAASHVAPMQSDAWTGQTVCAFSPLAMQQQRRSQPPGSQLHVLNVPPPPGAAPA